MRASTKSALMLQNLEFLDFDFDSSGPPSPPGFQEQIDLFEKEFAANAPELYFKNILDDDQAHIEQPEATPTDCATWIVKDNRLSPTKIASGFRKARDLKHWDRGSRKSVLHAARSAVCKKRNLRAQRRLCDTLPWNNPTEPRSKNMPQPITFAQHARHANLMITRVLSLRNNASPFTLVLDDLNQPAQPLLDEVTRRGLSRNINVVVVSFECKRLHPAVREVPGWGSYTGSQILGILENAMQDYKESLIIVDSLHDLLVTKGVDMNTIFQLVAIKYNSTLFGVYHTDIHSQPDTTNPYAPQPLELVKYMATTIFTCKSFAQVLADKRAKERSIASPLYGIGNEAEGAVQSLTANTPAGIVLAAEFRRRSGKPEFETFFLRASTDADYHAPAAGQQFGTLKVEFATLLDENPAYRQQPEGYGSPFGSSLTPEMISTFNLELTAKQKEAREGVVLPYFDAQKEGGGEGGRILYEMGVEDDFDEEEDEI